MRRRGWWIRMSGLHGLVAALTVAGFAAGADRAGAVIAFDARSVSFGTAVTFTFPHTVGIGNDRVMIVGVSIYNSNKTVSGVTYAGQALTRLGFLDGGSGANDRRMEMWRLVNPPTGTANVVMTMSSSAKLVVGAASFFGVNPAAPNGSFVSNEGNTILATLAVPSAVGELVIDCMAVQGNAASAIAGAGQTQLWNDFSRSNGGAVVGTASTEPGSPLVTMSWGLASVDYWVAGAVSLKPAPRPYQPDAMVKLASEADAAYVYTWWYENPAVLQVKSTSVLATVPASYRIQFQNDGENSDAFVITGTGSTAAFAVQYLDAGGIDRTAAVTGAGYTTVTLAAGASTTWTLNITPLATGGAGGVTHVVDVTATSVGNALRSDQVRAATTCLSPNLVLTKSVDLAGALPGQDITYSVAAVSSGLSDATGIVVVDSIPDYAGLRVGSVTFNPGTTSLTSAVSYSNDNGVTWTYTPVSGSCGAPAGCDYCVTHVRWTFSGSMPPNRSFTIGSAVRVK
jgi:uncharacterized repeat protein (TIGR01451 family)